MAKRRVFNIRLSDAEREILDYNAQLSQLSSSELLRKYVIGLPRPAHLEGMSITLEQPRIRRTRQQIADDLALQNEILDCITTNEEGVFFRGIKVQLD